MQGPVLTDHWFRTVACAWGLASLPRLICACRPTAALSLKLQLLHCLPSSSLFYPMITQTILIKKLVIPMAFTGTLCYGNMPFVVSQGTRHIRDPDLWRSNTLSDDWVLNVSDAADASHGGVCFVQYCSDPVPFDHQMLQSPNAVHAAPASLSLCVSVSDALNLCKRQGGLGQTCGYTPFCRPQLSLPSPRLHISPLHEGMCWLAKEHDRMCCLRAIGGGGNQNPPTSFSYFCFWCIPISVLLVPCKPPIHPLPLGVYQRSDSSRGQQLMTTPCTPQSACRIH